MVRGETSKTSSSGALDTAPKMVRGEILIRRAEAPKEAKIIRSWVNGVLHRKEGEALPPAGLLRFVAYKVVDSSAPIKEQFASLKAANYELPPHGYFQINDRNREGVEPMMIQLYQTERAEGAYEIDGIVLTSATGKPEKPTIENPKDTVAFKMSLAEQIAETTVTEVEWNLSRGGLLVPRVLIEPVTIGGATISKVTGHNAKFIVDSGLGPGATVNIRRSGDVIPIIDTVLVPVEPALPPKGSFKWEGVHIIPAVDEGGDPSRKLLHSLKVLGIKGAGEAAATELVKAGYLTIFDINNADISTLQSLIGTANGKKLKEGVAAAIGAADLTTQILSYPDLPAGLGSSRIEIFVSAGADFDGPMIEGFGPQTWASLQSAKKDIKTWISRFPAKAKSNKASVSMVPSKGPICFTGFRLKPDEKTRVEAAGWIPKDSFTSTCKFLIVPHLPYESTKVDSAKKFGVPIIDRDTFMRSHLG
jgi:DNA ligase (NAD+)